MTVQGWLQVALFVAALGLHPLVGGYMYQVYAGEPILLARVLGPVERGIYRLLRTDPARGQDWKGYARTTLIFSALCFVALFVILRRRGSIRSTRRGITPAPGTSPSTPPPRSCPTRTGSPTPGSPTMGLFVADGRTWPCRTSCLRRGRHGGGVAVIRGFAPVGHRPLGNFWVDLARGRLCILLPISWSAACSCPRVRCRLSARTEFSTLAGH